MEQEAAEQSLIDNWLLIIQQHENWGSQMFSIFDFNWYYSKQAK